MPPISAIIICKNEEKDIAGAIESLLWADEVLLVDSYSTDNTLAIAKEYPVRVLQHAFVNYSLQRNWALAQATHNWVLMLDADERITPDLQEEIKELLHGSPAKPAYSIIRKNFFMGKEVRFSGWQNDGVVRLFDKSQTSYANKSVHESLILKDRPGKLKHKILHYTYKNLPHCLQKSDAYSWLAAQDKIAHTGRITLFHLALKPMFRFFRHYFLKLGFLDGKVGFTISVMAALGVFMRYLKIWRMRQEHTDQN